MYKTTSSKHNYMGRTGSHSTKPLRSLSETTSDFSQYVRSLSLEEARHELDALGARRGDALQKRLTMRKGSDELRKQNRLLDILQINMGFVKRHIGELKHAADAANDYNTLTRAVEEICGRAIAAKILLRKLEIQHELAGVILPPAPKSSGRPRKPVHERNGGTMEQAMAKALADHLPPA